LWCIFNYDFEYKQNMKVFTLLLFVSSTLFGQVQKKDTLYFNYDVHYILFSNNYENYSYKEFEQKVTENIKWTGTEGYFLFKKSDTIYNLQPNKVHSLKGYVEQRKFYYPGKYSRTVNNTLLNNELFNKHIIFIVDNNNRFIKIRQNPYGHYYNSFYPIKFSSEKLIQKPLRDTIFLKYDEEILSRKKNPNENEFYYLIDGFASKSELTYFAEKEVYQKLQPKNIKNLQEIINKIKKDNNKNKVRNSDLQNYFSNAGYVIFIVKDKKCYKVEIYSYII